MADVAPQAVPTIITDGGPQEPQFFVPIDPETGMAYRIAGTGGGGEGVGSLGRQDDVDSLGVALSNENVATLGEVVTQLTAATGSLATLVTTLGNIAADNSTITVKGGVAEGAASTDAPNTIGGRASTTHPTSQDDGDVTKLRTSSTGEIIVKPHQVRNLIGRTVSPIALEITTGTKFIENVADVYNDLLMLKLENTTDNEETVTIYDDEAKSVVTSSWTVPPKDTVGVTYPVGWQQTAVNKEWWAVPSATGIKLEAQWSQQKA